jgi:L-methionine (R)-S-oxide reductase
MNTIVPAAQGAAKADAYRHLYRQLQELLQGESDFLANAANASALLYHSLPEINWAGFYLLRDEELVLGPFQGKPACTRIPLGKGVCGTAAQAQETVIVRDVNEFAGHIVCDSNSKSEIVVPLLNWGRVLGVLDLDSPVLNRFDEEDQEGLEALMALLISSFPTNDMPDFEAMASNTAA